MGVKQDASVWSAGAYVSFDDWVKRREIAYWGTNTGAPIIAFQGWRHFKEAFAPELIKRAIAESEISVETCLDPFGGSGTTALACQFLGVKPITIEVNPYLADLIEAKLSSYDVSSLIRDLGRVVKESHLVCPNMEEMFASLPSTFIEPGEGGRWVFNIDIARRIAALRLAIAKLKEIKHKRLFLALLGGVLVDASNVVVSGKGRRYRRGWELQERNSGKLDSLFQERAVKAIGDIQRYAERAVKTYDLLRGDCRSQFEHVSHVDACVFSPPYPNSFDYTDVYNVELWALGYLNSRGDNIALRNATLSSHVQIFREFSSPPNGSRDLASVMQDLQAARSGLWNKHIPEMVGGYFADMQSILLKIYERLAPGGQVWMVVGDSCYAGINIPVAKILIQLSKKLGYRCNGVEPFRSMRMSPQQGGQFGLDESLVVLIKPMKGC